MKDGESKFEEVTCDSGIRGWRGRLQDVYTDIDEFQAFSNIYNFADKLGYGTARGVWHANPLMEGSSIPSDLRVVHPTEQIVGSQEIEVGI